VSASKSNQSGKSDRGASTRSTTSTESTESERTTARTHSIEDAPVEAPPSGFTTEQSEAAETPASPASVDASNVATDGGGDQHSLTDAEVDSAATHPSGQLTVTQEGAALGVKNYESVDEGPRSQLDLDAGTGAER
jgi:hypothetical protein